jgi:hypothetical protein
VDSRGQSLPKKRGAKWGPEITKYKRDKSPRSPS